MKKSPIILALLCIISVCFTMFYGIDKIKSKSNEQPLKYEGVLVIWQIDVFEGGYGSRKQFLLEVASEFEKQNSGVLVLCVSHTVESAKQSFLEGVYPDIISFGVGVEIENFIEIETDLEFNSSTLKNKTYALPWCRGNYYLLSHAENEIELEQENVEQVIVSQNTFTQPLTALSLEGYKLSKYESYSPLDAYVRFVADKKSILLGTQRDVVRLTNRGLDFNYKVLKEFSDLYQYVAITTKSEAMRYFAQKYLDILMSEKWQKKLENISMTSCFYKVENNIGGIKVMNDASPKFTLSPFTHPKVVTSMQELSSSAVLGDANATLKLKNMMNIP